MTVLISLYFQTSNQNGLIFSVISKTFRFFDRKMTEKKHLERKPCSVNTFDRVGDADERHKRCFQILSSSSLSKFAELPFMQFVCCQTICLESIFLL